MTDPTSVTVAELLDRTDELLDKTTRGQTFVITRGGEPFAELRPLASRGTSTAELIARRRHLPAIDPVRLRQDLDGVVDQSL